jgi:predicted molibdopterin-dependent oxidoreductase YjgC
MADIVLSSPSISEKTGSIALGDDSVVNIEEALPPLGASKSEMAVLQRLILMIGKKELSMDKLNKDLKLARKRTVKTGSIEKLGKDITREISSYKGRKVKPYTLVADEDIAHFMEGSYTKKFYWPDRVCGDPLIDISRKNAAELNIRDGDEVIVRSKNGELMLDARVTDAVPDDYLFVPAHFLDVRNLFGRNISDAKGRIVLDPVNVSVEKVR